MDNNDKTTKTKASVNKGGVASKPEQEFKPSMLLDENNDWAGHLKFLDVNIEKIDNFFKMKEKEKSDTNNHLCIDGSWGTGKSVFTENIAFKWSKSPNNKSNKIIKINLWEYEILPWPEDKVLLDILFNIFNEKTFNNIFEKIKIWFKQSEKSFGLNSDLNIFGTTILNFSFELQTNQKTKENKNHTNLIDEIKKETSHNNYLFILDELERCSPDYQLKFLNLIKNLLFKLAGVFFLIPCNCNAINKIALNYLKITKINESLEMYTDKIFYQTFNIESVTKLDFSKIDKIDLGPFLKDNFGTNLRLFHKIFDNEKIYASIFKNISPVKKFNIKYSFTLWPLFSFYMYYLKYSHQKLYNEFIASFIRDEIKLKIPEYRLLFCHPELAKEKRIVLTYNDFLKLFKGELLSSKYDYFFKAVESKLLPNINNGSFKSKKEKLLQKDISFLKKFFQSNLLSSKDNDFMPGMTFEYKDGFYIESMCISHHGRSRTAEYWDYNPKWLAMLSNKRYIEANNNFVDDGEKVLTAHVGSVLNIKEWLRTLNNSTQIFTFSDHIKKLRLLMIEYLQNSSKVLKINLVVGNFDNSTEKDKYYCKQQNTTIEVYSIAPIKQIEDFIKTELIFY